MCRPTVPVLVIFVGIIFPVVWRAQVPISWVYVFVAYLLQSHSNPFADKQSARTEINNYLPCYGKTSRWLTFKTLKQCHYTKLVYSLKNFHGTLENRENLVHAASLPVHDSYTYTEHEQVSYLLLTPEQHVIATHVHIASYVLILWGPIP